MVMVAPAAIQLGVISTIMILAAVVPVVIVVTAAQVLLRQLLLCLEIILVTPVVQAAAAEAEAGVQVMVQKMSAELVVTGVALGS